MSYGFIGSWFVPRVKYCLTKAGGGEDGYSVRAWEQVVTEWEFGRDAGAAGSAVVVVMINGNV